MLAHLYQVYDLCAEAHIGPIILERAHGPALRTFTTVLQDKNTMIGQYPQHYDLIWLGDIEDTTGVITPLTHPQIMLAGAQWLTEHKGTLAGDTQ